MDVKAKLTVDPGRVLVVLLVTWALLVLAHFVAMEELHSEKPLLNLVATIKLEYWHVQFLDLDSEESFATWFSCALLFLAGALSFVKYLFEKQGAGRFRTHWLVLSIGFCFLSVDEEAGVHEWINTFDFTALKSSPLRALGTEIDWTVIVAPLLLLVAIAYVPFLWKYAFRTSRSLIVIAGVVYVAGALGVEHVTDENGSAYHYSLMTMLEEGLEMLGMILFNYAILDDLRKSGGGIDVHFGSSGPDCGPTDPGAGRVPPSP